MNQPQKQAGVAETILALEYAIVVSKIQAVTEANPLSGGGARRWTRPLSRS